MKQAAFKPYLISSHTQNKESPLGLPSQAVHEHHPDGKTSHLSSENTVPQETSSLLNYYRRNLGKP
jgi:hypothetical protein